MLSSSGVGGWERMDVLAGCLLNAQPAHCCSVSGNDDYFYVFCKRLNSQVMERERYLSVGMLVDGENDEAMLRVYARQPPTWCLLTAHHPHCSLAALTQTHPQQPHLETHSNTNTMCVT